ncbi:hypothetical protein GIW45_01220 [Pseudomonas congelans]|nr:hypothetical protein [Pseudomonas congelans]
MQVPARTPSCPSSYTSPLWILAGGRGSELVRERGCMIAENSPNETPSS